MSRLEVLSMLAAHHRQSVDEHDALSSPKEIVTPTFDENSVSSVEENRDSVKRTWGFDMSPIETSAKRMRFEEAGVPSAPEPATTVVEDFNLNSIVNSSRENTGSLLWMNNSTGFSTGLTSTTILNMLLAQVQNDIVKLAKASDEVNKITLMPPSRALFQETKLEKVPSSASVGSTTSQDSSYTSQSSCSSSSNNNNGATKRSSYRGVIWDKNSRAWRAKLSVKGKLMHVGLFEDEREAAIAWDRKALEIRGSRTALNFPDMVTQLANYELKSQRIRKNC